MPEVTPSTMANFLEWIFSSKLSSVSGQFADALVYGAGLDLYIFSDGYDVPQLRQDVLSLLFSKLRLTSTPNFPTELIVKAYDNLMSGDPLLKLLVEKFWRDVKIESLSEQDCDELPVQYVWSTTIYIKTPRALRQSYLHLSELPPTMLDF